MKEDYYKILGLDKNATDSEIKKAYRNALLNIILIKIQEIKKRKKNLKKLQKPMKY